MIDEPDRNTWIAERVRILMQQPDAKGNMRTEHCCRMLAGKAWSLRFEKQRYEEWKARMRLVDKEIMNKFKAS
jgi:hypothetical protein